MNNKDYMEYQGNKILQIALLENGSSKGSDLYFALEKKLNPTYLDMSADPNRSIDDFFWSYLSFRLYIAQQVILHYKNGLSARHDLAKGLAYSMSHLDKSLQILALQRTLLGTYLCLPKEKPERLWATDLFQEIDRKAMEQKEKEPLTYAIEETLWSLSSYHQVRLTEDEVEDLTKEIKNFRNNLSEKLQAFTPETIYKRAKARCLLTDSYKLTSHCIEATYPSIAVMGGMMVGLLMMFA